MAGKGGGRCQPWRFAGNLIGREKEERERGQTVMDSRRGKHDVVEEIDTNEAEFEKDEKRDRESSPNLRRKFAGTQAVDAELRREVEGATSGGSR
jgi:hypothetical protein